MPSGSISTLKSGLQPISVPLVSIILASPTNSTDTQATGQHGSVTNSATTNSSNSNTERNVRCSALFNSSKPLEVLRVAAKNSKNHRYSLLCTSTAEKTVESSRPLSLIKTNNSANRRSLLIDSTTPNLMFPLNNAVSNPNVQENSTPMSFPSNNKRLLTLNNHNQRAICLKPPPMPTLVSKVEKTEGRLKTSDDSSVNKAKRMNKDRRLTQINSNHITEQYGRLTEAGSINKLDTNAVEFLKQTRYLSQLRLMYPKLSINLNENLKNLYFFGDKNQVIYLNIFLLSNIKNVLIG